MAGLRKENEDLRLLTACQEQRVVHAHREKEQDRDELTSLESILDLLHLREVLEYPHTFIKLHFKICIVLFTYERDNSPKNESDSTNCPLCFYGCSCGVESVDSFLLCQNYIVIVIIIGVNGPLLYGP